MIDYEALGKRTLSLQNLMKELKLTLSVAESCTGGLLQSAVTMNSGSSTYFLGGVVAYSNLVKSTVLKIDQRILEAKGAVSRETVEKMSFNCRKLFNSDFALAITGIAGPLSDQSNKPVGLVYLGITDNCARSRVYDFQFSGSRNEIQLQAVENALAKLLLVLRDV